MRFFRSGATPGRLRLGVALSDPSHDIGPHTSWTLHNRKYELRDQGEKTAFILESEKTMADCGQVCYVPLGSDLRPGRYSLRVSFEDHDPGYVVLSRTTPGIGEYRKVFLEERSAAGAF